MQKLMPIFKVTPIVLFLYGAIRSVFDALEVQSTMSSILINADGTAGTRVLSMNAYLRAVDPLFFYLAMAAVVAAAVQYLERV